MIIQAGGSEPGQELSARTADIVFSVVNGDTAEAKAAYDGLKARLPKHGRAPGDMAILPGVMPIIGRTDAEAKAQLDRLQSWLTPTNALALVSHRIGHDISGYPLDGPVPELPPDQQQPVVRARAARHGAAREDDAARSLQYHGRGARPLGDLRHAEADRRHAGGMVRAGLADGFMILPAYFPGAFDDFVDLVVPELQRRGLFRTEYAGSTLREHLRPTTSG